ncbi:hypothetical protein LR48_Vigan08g052700 [Vigna angularis]|uniref:PAS domain-containing protein n=1 Tax=Phaseolus angularis TaxID=3914 RepID=A0A0L9V3P9_PHAAN|nr:hypothetical protein LR48_Vigan08g052700 [Vigna angularis]
MDELSSVALEMVRLIETATIPIFGVDSGEVINGWNSKIAELTSLQGSEALGKSMVNEIIHADSCQDITYEKMVQDKFIKLGGDYKAIVQSLSPLIPPIFSSDESAYCSEWNATMERLTGWKRDEVIGKLLPGEIFGSFGRLKENRSNPTRLTLNVPLMGLSGVLRVKTGAQRPWKGAQAWCGKKTGAQCPFSMLSALFLHSG